MVTVVGANEVPLREHTLSAVWAQPRRDMEEHTSLHPTRDVRRQITKRLSGKAAQEVFGDGEADARPTEFARVNVAVQPSSGPPALGLTADRQ
jgi:hypothetical protein